MSDNWIVFVPIDPNFIPEVERQSLAQSSLLAMVKHGDEVACQSFETVQFFDCGANFEAIHCHSCGQEISVEWWQERMEEDFAAGFQLKRYSAHCCNKASTLHELVYTQPQAFGRFSFEVMNPEVALVSEQEKQELEEILQTKLVVVYQRL